MFMRDISEYIEGSKKLNSRLKNSKSGSLFKEIRMIPQLDPGPLHYGLGNLDDIVCLTQKLEGINAAVQISSISCNIETVT